MRLPSLRFSTPIRYESAHKLLGGSPSNLSGTFTGTIQIKAY